MNDDEDQEPGNSRLWTLQLPQAFLENEMVEMPIPEGHPDIVIDPSNFHEEVWDKDHHYHRLPIGILSNIDGHIVNIDEAIEEDLKMVSHIIAHGDGKAEALLFPILYPHGQDSWQYKRPPTQVSRDSG